MPQLIHVSLDGEIFVVRVGEAFEESPFTYYPLEVEHIASGMSTDSFGPAESADPKTILGEYGFAEDFSTFYRRIFGRAPEADRFKWVDCMQPECPAFYDAARRDLPAGGTERFTGWQFPHDEETTSGRACEFGCMPEDHDPEEHEVAVHDHYTEDGEGRS
jgi:hypothetical protein